MADIRPFQGVRYNPALVKDLAGTICPPHDVITPQLQQQLYQRSEHNFVRLECGREFPQDKDQDNRYTRASAFLETWLEKGILKKDAIPAIYVDDHHFTLRGKKYRRRNISCLVRLEEWDSMTIRPHEATFSHAKGDRLNLLWALQANTSPIMALYEDVEGRVSSALAAQSREKPLINIKNDATGEQHRFGAVTDTGAIRQIQDSLAGHPLYIADGHHRYESALAYCRERHTWGDSVSGNEPHDFVLMTLVDFADPGLVILPAHRLLRGTSPSAIERLRASLETCFNIEEYILDEKDIVHQIENLLTGSAGEVKLVLYGLQPGRLSLLTLRDFNAVRPMIPYFHSEIYLKLDVSIADHVIIEELLGLTRDDAGTYLDYTYDIREAINRVREREYQLAVIVNPVKPEVIKTIADNGDRMPRKSTYFYPKIPAGLVFYRFV